MRRAKVEAAIDRGLAPLRRGGCHGGDRPQRPSEDRPCDQCDGDENEHGQPERSGERRIGGLLGGCERDTADDGPDAPPV